MTKSLREKAMDYLGRREHSRLELEKKLRNKDFSDHDIHTALNQLSADNLQSDERFAESYVRYRKLAGFGPKRIEMELRERGIKEFLIKEAVNASSSNWQTQLQNTFEKKYTWSSLKDMKNRQQAFRFLLYRGYTFDAISSLFDGDFE